MPAGVKLLLAPMLMVAMPCLFVAMSIDFGFDGFDQVFSVWSSDRVFDVWSSDGVFDVWSSDRVFDEKFFFWLLF